MQITETPTPLPSQTPLATYTAAPTYTPFPTLTPAPQVIQYVQLNSGRSAAVEFTASAGDLLISSLLFVLIILLGMVYLEIRNRPD